MDHSFLLSVVNAEVPYSFYLVNTNNNKYKINGTSYSISIGNYNILELIDKLQSNHPTFTFSYKETTNKLTISAPTAFSMTNDGLEPFLRLIGFRLDIYNGLSSYESDSVVDLSGYNNIFIYSNLGSENYDSYLSRGSHVLCKIPLTSSANGVIFYENTFGTRHIIDQTNISDIKLQLLSNLYSPIDLNHIDFTIALQLDCILNQSENVDVNIGQVKQQRQKINYLL